MRTHRIFPTTTLTHIHRHCPQLTLSYTYTPVSVPADTHTRRVSFPPFSWCCCLKLLSNDDSVPGHLEKTSLSILSSRPALRKSTGKIQSSSRIAARSERRKSGRKDNASWAACISLNVFVISSPSDNSSLALSLPKQLGNRVYKNINSAMLFLQSSLHSFGLFDVLCLLWRLSHKELKQWQWTGHFSWVYVLNIGDFVRLTQFGDCNMCGTILRQAAHCFIDVA